MTVVRPESESPGGETPRGDVVKEAAYQVCHRCDREPWPIVRS